jgi:heme exporter protein A
LAGGDGDENRSGRKICFPNPECGFDSRRPHQMKTFGASGVHLWRGERHVLCDVHFELAAGQCLQVTGANGAGKTSLLRALSGLLPLEAGEVHWCGQPIHKDPARFHEALAWAAHQGGLKGDLTATENVRFGALIGERCNAEAIAGALQRTGLDAPLQSRLARHLSAGQQRRVTLARLIVQQRPLWLLDEPQSHLDAGGQTLLQALVAEHLQAGGLAVIATHDALNLPSAMLRRLELH